MQHVLYRHLSDIDFIHYTVHTLMFRKGVCTVCTNTYISSYVCVWTIVQYTDRHKTVFFYTVHILHTYYVYQTMVFVQYGVLIDTWCVVQCVWTDISQVFWHCIQTGVVGQMCAAQYVLTDMNNVVVEYMNICTYTVGPLLRDTPNKGHYRNNLSTKDTLKGTKNRLSYSVNTVLPLKGGQPLCSQS